MQIGAGFDQWPGFETTIALLDEDTCRKCEQDFSVNSQRFKLVQLNGGNPLRITGAGG